MAKKKARFLRIGYTQYSKLGLRRKNKQKYRKGKGGENKMRLKMKGHLRNVDIGFRSEKDTRGLIRGLNPVLVYSVENLEKLNKNEIAIVAKIGDKKKMEIAQYAVKHNIRLSNLNAKKFLMEIEENMKKRKEDKAKKHGKKAEKEKKAKEAEKKSETKGDKKEEKENKEGNIEDKVQEKPAEDKNEPEK